MNRTFSASDFNRISAIAHQVARRIFKKEGFARDNFDIEEVVSATIERAFMNWDSYDESISMNKWFCIIAKNCAYSYMKKTYVDRACRGDWDISMIGDDSSFLHVDADAELVSQERIATIKSAIDQLGKKEGRALMLLAQGYSQEEIQNDLGVNNGALRTLISRGRRHLAESKCIRGVYG